MFHLRDIGSNRNIKLIFIAKAFALLTFIYGVYVLIRNLKFLVRRDFFNHKLVQCFSKSGKLDAVAF